MTRMVGDLAAVMSDIRASGARARVTLTPAAELRTRAGIFDGRAFVAPHAWMVNEPFPRAWHPAGRALLLLSAAGRKRVCRLGGLGTVRSFLAYGGATGVFHMRGAARVGPFVHRHALRDRRSAHPVDADWRHGR